MPSPDTEILASSFRLRANAPEGRKAISYQLGVRDADPAHAGFYSFRGAGML